ncbi:MAG: EAL domain-containing protein [Microcoleus sp. PH2017_15_JOR_U_A]|uniref:sensor domain-containing protein n=1 Tax=unclassified Microcoleus TaxID=2642155 RepID=UPI001DA498B0|nr:MULTISPECIES: EAL domain-containing protein [unclassified Microcoleus]MCC3472105.1 EAL domain-containing protein [Microcoleus sp. PH2017_13_LAR_U_A]MCC3484652.1 EAL domain-containing protein [Microcoleus sp. PH2017_14_LAR_D_A]MCC3499171.1 EAL domain-containing protein [Microcoleus sp. PH2017_15_JOR_U_A]MCC3595607.1 EAL domain-containing protein [Microcoleus sp. PH2017_26_ELK_O_A]MCC3622154.1 EAL domain-containing protein [Microcoleus sp. PH2017_36_ELK_O_B]
MKITYQLILVSLTAAIFGVECSINSIKLSASIGDITDNRSVEAILLEHEKLSSLGASSRPTTSATADLFVDNLSQREAVHLPSDNFIHSPQNSENKRSFGRETICSFLAFISIVISLLIRTNTATILSKTSGKSHSETEKEKLPEAKKVLRQKKEQDIGDTIAKMTQDLQQTAEYALDICEEMSVSIVATTPGGHILSSNQATCQLLGYSKKELLGKQIAGLFKQTESPAAGLESATLTAQGSVRNVEKVYLSKQGKKIIVLLSISTIRDGKGEVSGKLYVAQDITDSKRAERDLRRSEKKFRQLVETVNAAAFIYQRRQLRYVNSQTEALTGYTREELLGLDLYDFIHPDFRSTVKQWGKSRQPRDSAGSKYEVRIITKTGETRWIEATVDIIKFERKASILVTAFDISHRKLAELELETSLSLLQATIESTADGILAVDGSGKVVSFNRKFAQMWQLPDFLLDSRDSNQILGFGISQLRYPEIFLNRAKELSDIPAAESFDVIEFQDGRIVERYSLPQHTGGKITGRVFSFRDVTERWQSEEKLRKSEERFHLLTRATNDAVWDFNVSRNEYWLSEEFEKVFGYKLNETQTIDLESWWLNVHAEERERVKSSFNETMNSDAQCWSEEYSFRRADGGYVFVLDRGYIIRNASGQAVRAIGTMMDITQRRQAEEIIRYQAVYDQLTGLPNRILFNDRLLASLKQAKKNEKMLAVMFLDLDRFKKINDTLGHAAGDRLLEGFAGRISDTLRSTDTVARWGGDEFTVLLPEINCLEDAIKTAQRILDNLKPAFKLEQQAFHISSSIGIALYPNDGEDAETLVKNADAALYRAKERGRNNYQLYTATLNPEGSQLLNIENRLHEALEQGEFEIFYQPKVNITTWKIQGMEALLRWKHPELGLVSPATFIPIAEENGLIVPIGEWVLQTACTQNKAWQDALQPDLRVAVNFSARQFQQFNLVQMVANCLERTGLAPKYLELEITETTAMQDVDYTTKVLRELQAMGVQIALDDFGTGYCSLNYLKKFPLNILKIDKSFVSELTTDPCERAIANAVATLGRDLNLSVVAEGVETKEQLDCLRSLHCHEIQGHYFSTALSAGDASKLLVNCLLRKVKIA